MHDGNVKLSAPKIHERADKEALAVKICHVAMKTGLHVSLKDYPTTSPLLLRKQLEHFLSICPTRGAMGRVSSLLVFSLLLCSLADKAPGQGTLAFRNLDFESAYVLGFGTGDLIPISAALPGWSASQGSFQEKLVVYDTINLSGGGISILDQYSQFFAPLQGSYSALLEGSDPNFGFIPATISQTGLIPNSTMSLLADMNWGGSLGDLAPVITIDGQPITMVPLQNFPKYTLYAGDISSFAGKSATLSFTAHYLELDNISFSTAAVPEPGLAVLLVIGASLFGWRFQTKRRVTQPTRVFSGNGSRALSARSGSG
jgi:hypothetical protein